MRHYNRIRLSLFLGLLVFALLAQSVAADQNSEATKNIEADRCTSASPDASDAGKVEGCDQVETMVVVGSRADKAWLEVPAPVPFVERDAIQRSRCA